MAIYLSMVKTKRTYFLPTAKWPIPIVINESKKKFGNTKLCSALELSGPNLALDSKVNESKSIISP